MLNRVVKIITFSHTHCEPRNQNLLSSRFVHVRIWQNESIAIQSSLISHPCKFDREIQNMYVDVLDFYFSGFNTKTFKLWLEVWFRIEQEHVEWVLALFWNFLAVLKKIWNSNSKVGTRYRWVSSTPFGVPCHLPVQF